MRFVIFIVLFNSILFLGHWFLYRTLVRFLGMSSPSRLLTLKVALGLLSVSLGSDLFFLLSRHSSLVVRCLYTVAASWLGIFYLFILASILCWVLPWFYQIMLLPLNEKILIQNFVRNGVDSKPLRIINAGVIRLTRISLSLPHCPSAWKGKTAVW